MQGVVDDPRCPNNASAELSISENGATAMQQSHTRNCDLDYRCSNQISRWFCTNFDNVFDAIVNE